MDESYKLFQLGREQLDKEDYLKAIEFFASSNELSEHFKTLELLGEANIKVGNLSAAIQPLAKATELNNGVRAPSLLSKVFLDLGESEKAKIYAELALERDLSNKIAKSVLECINVT